MVPIRLKIAILGQPLVVKQDDDGRPVTRTFVGAVRPCVLTALVMADGPRHGYRISQSLWKDEHPKRSLQQHEASFNAALSRLRKDLALDGTERYDLIPPATGEGIRLMRPDYLLTDWDLFNDLIEANDFQAALALVRDMPLAGLNELTEPSREWLVKIRNEVRAKVAGCFGALNIPVSEPLDLGDLPVDDSWQAPEIWTNALVDTAEAMPDRAVPRPRPRRISEVDDSTSQFALSVLFDNNELGRTRYAREVEESQRKGITLWWSDVSSEWFGGYFAFWHSPHTVDPAGIKLSYTEGRYDSARFEVPECDGDNDKAVIVSGSNFYSDNRDHKELRLGTTTWNFAFEWAKDHARDLIDGDVPVSVFGLTDRSAYPGIAGVHTLLCTSDGYLLLALRDHRVQFYPETWSASFEESVSVGARDYTGPLGGDQTIMDPIIGGLYEEWGIEEDTIAVATCMAVGREFVQGDDGRLDLSSSVLAAVRLKIDLDGVWKCLDEGSRIRDLDEHRSWAGCQFGSRANVLRFLAAAKDQQSGVDLLPQAMDACEGSADLRFYPKGAVNGIVHRGLMPTSAARLYLGSAWMRENRWLD